MQIDNIGILRKGHKELCHCAADIADHDTGDEQGRHMVDGAGHHQDKSRGHHGAGKSCQNQCPGRSLPKPADQKDHNDRDTHLCTGGNAEHKGARDGVPEKCLQQETGKSQGASQNCSLQDPRHTDLPDNADLLCRALPPEQDLQNPCDRDLNAARIDIQNDHYQ